VLDDDNVPATSALISVIRNFMHNTIAGREHVEGPAVVDSTVHFAQLPADGVPARAVGAGYGATRSRVLETIKHVSILAYIPPVMNGGSWPFIYFTLLLDMD
jgi:hypothetical protein